MNKNKLTEKIKNTVKAGALAATMAMPNVANANLVTNIDNYVDEGRITFNIFDDTGAGLQGATLFDFYGGDLLKSNITSVSGDLNNVPFGTFGSLNDNNGDGVLSGELFYSITGNPLNITGNSIITFSNNQSLNSIYDVNNIAQTPIPGTALLFASGLPLLMGAKRKETIKKMNSFFTTRQSLFQD